MANLFSLIFSFSFVLWSFENSEDTISFSLPHPDRHPLILYIKSKSLNPTTGEIEFETDDETKSEIEFGLAEDYGSRIEGTWNLKHRFILPALRHRLILI